MRIEELVHLDPLGREIRRQRNILNRVHLLGEDFVLRCLFAGGNVPSSYYIGLDSRESLSISDSMSSLQGKEPNEFGYERRAVGSDEFAVVTNPNSTCQANSPSVVFSASGGGWNPVRNIFLCTGLGYGPQSILISSAPLGQDLVVNSGETVSMRMSMALSACQ